MRNLKKILALVLALMMVLSVMVTASAAKFEDADSITYAEAVNVMTAAGVLKGYEAEDGTSTFKPQGTLTRAEAAKLIAYVKLGADIDLIAKSATEFSDVPAGHWASGYIAFCYGRGYVVGNGNGKYAPNDPVTGYQFAKMLLLALGVEDTLAEQVDGAYVNQYTGADYAIKVALAMKGTPLRTGLPQDMNLNKNLTREEAAQLAFNALSWDKDGAGAGESILTGDFGIAAAADTVDSFGRPVINVWKKGDTTVYSEVEEYLEKLNSADFDPTKTGTGEKYKGYTFPDTVVYNGGGYTTLTPATLKNSNAMTVELYGTKNLDGTVDVTKVVAYEYYFTQVTAINETTGDITLAVQEAGTVRNNGNTTVTVSATKTAGKYSADYTALANYKVGDVFALCVKQGWAAGEEFATWGTNILDVAEVTALTGNVTSTSIKENGGYKVYTGSFIRVDGVKYEFSSQYNREPIALGTKAEAGTFYTLNGKLVGYVPVDNTPAASTTENLVYLVGYRSEYVEGVDEVVDKYGEVVTEGYPSFWNKYAHVVTLAGEQVELYVGSTLSNTLGQDNGVEILYTAAQGLYEVSSTTNAQTGVVTYSLANNAISTAISLNAISFDDQAIKFSDGGNTYYYIDAEVTQVIGSKDKVEVTEGSLAGVKTNKAAAYAVFSGEEANKTVSAIIYWVAEATEDVVYTDVLYVHDATLIETSSVMKDEATQATETYAYSVYLGTEKAEIFAYENLSQGMYKYTVDKYGVYVVEAINDEILAANVNNVYGNLITIECGAEDIEDYDITDVTIVDLTQAANSSDKIGGNGKIDKDEKVTCVVSIVAGQPVIGLIYIVPAAQ